MLCVCVCEGVCVCECTYVDVVCVANVCVLIYYKCVELCDVKYNNMKYHLLTNSQHYTV